MFGWFKRKPKPVTLAASWDYEPKKYVFVSSKRVASVRVHAEHEQVAWDLILRVDNAIRQKKKHSHLLAELKALEVK